MSSQAVVKRALITGASGLLGTALVSELHATGQVDMTALSSRDVDLTNLDATVAVFQTFRPDIVYHLAARVYGIMGNLRRQGLSYYDNTRINTNVIEASRLCGARKVVAMGSAAIYSDNVPLPMREEDIWLGPPHASEAGYAHAKRGMLAQLAAYQDQYDLDYAYCVSTNLFGPNDKFDEENGHVLPSLLSKFHRAIRDSTDVVVWGTGKATRDFLYSKDAARAMRMAGERISGPINLATGTAISIEEVVGILQEVSGFSGRIVWDRNKPDGQKLRDYDITKLRALEFKTEYSLREALAETYSWLTAHADTVRH